MISSAATPHEVFPLPYTQHDFPNGLRLITVPTDYPNVVAIYIVVQAGSRNEIEPGKSGFAHFFEHMMFHGTKTFPPERYEATLRNAGAACNAYTSDDLTVYHTTFSKEDLETILAMEADRFQHLEYSESVFRTEALAVLGEYNKNSAAPTTKLHEVLRETAFDNHTYKHTTMGFLADINDMPNQYAYSRTFFDRFYRPEYVTLLVVGDLKPGQCQSLVAQYWESWKRGSYRAVIPREAMQENARSAVVEWPTATLPWVHIAFRGPAYSDNEKDYAALDVLGFIGFSDTSDLYRKLVIHEQKVDTLFGGIPPHVDPYLFTIGARIKNPSDVDYVRSELLSTAAAFRENLEPAGQLDNVKRHLRYSFAQQLNNSDTIAATLAHFVALRRTPETINRLYAVYDSLTPEDLRAAARAYLVDTGRSTVTLIASH